MRTENTGNGMALSAGAPRRRHGLYVKGASGLKLRDEKRRRLVRKMFGAMPWLEMSDTPAVKAWAEIEILATDVYAYLRAIGPVNEKMEGRRLPDDYRKLRQTQALLTRELGMTPAARMALKTIGGRTAFDLASAMAAHDIGEAEERGPRARLRNRNRPANALRGVRAPCQGVAPSR